MKSIATHSIASCTSDRRTRNRLFSAALAAALGSAMLVSLDIRPAMAQATVAVVDVVAVAQGYRASKLIGANVENATGEDIGNIDDLIIDKQQVLYAILQVGGFLGLGGYLVAVPFENLQISEDGSRIVLTTGGSKEELQQTQEFTYGQTQQTQLGQPTQQQQTQQDQQSQQPQTQQDQQTQQPQTQQDQQQTPPAQ